MKKSDFFENELKYIQNQDIRTFAECFLNECVPDYFYDIPASQSGKYHPTYAIGEHGLVLHTRAAMMIANSLFETDLYGFSARQKDLILLALLAHDTYKGGIENNGETLKEHPNIAADRITIYIIKYEKEIKLFSLEDIHFLFSCIVCHMGKWNEINGKEKLPLPNTDAEKFVHMCDYLASRKFIEIRF